ncbi:MAG: hypothetical protein ACPGO3_07250 [Magnetospiraceae bacterium]
MKILTGGFFVAVMAVTMPVAQAQNQGFESQWVNPDSQQTRPAPQVRPMAPNRPVVQPRPAQRRPAQKADDRMAVFLKDLEALLKEAEANRSASPAFVEQVRELIYSQRSPWPLLVLKENFGDGDFQRDPTWRVAQGAYQITPQKTLRSHVVDDGSGQKPRNVDVAERIAETALQESLSTNMGFPRQDAVIYTEAPLSNAFSFSLVMATHRQFGAFEFGVYQSGSGDGGYRVVYNGERRLQLLRVGRNGAKVLGRSAQPISFQVNKNQGLRLNRFTNGKMVVTVNGRDVITVNDKAFKQPFSGVVLANRGGDHSVVRLTVRGLRK